MTSDVISMTSEEARQQAQVEGLTLRVAESKTVQRGARARAHQREVCIHQGGWADDVEVCAVHTVLGARPWALSIGARVVP